MPYPRQTMTIGSIVISPMHGNIVFDSRKIPFLPRLSKPVWIGRESVVWDQTLRLRAEGEAGAYNALKCCSGKTI